MLQRRARRLSRLEVTSSLNKLFLVVSTLVGYSPLCLKLVDRLFYRGVYFAISVMDSVRLLTIFRLGQRRLSQADAGELIWIKQTM